MGSEGLYIPADFNVLIESSGGNKMATFTVSVPKEFAEAKKQFPHINWNEVLKRGLIRRLEELKKFRELKARGAL